MERENLITVFWRTGDVDSLVWDGWSIGVFASVQEDLFHESFDFSILPLHPLLFSHSRIPKITLSSGYDSVGGSRGNKALTH